MLMSIQDNQICSDNIMTLSWWLHGTNIKKMLKNI
jgi:hypothetical protein